MRMKLLCKDFNIVNMRVMFSFAMVSWHGVWWRWSCSWVCFKHCLLSFWECREKPNARKTMWLGLEIKLIKDWIGVMVVLICLCTRECYIVDNCMKKIHIWFLLSVTPSSKLVKITRNEPGTTPKTSRKFKQTMLNLYPDEFSCRLFCNIQSFCSLDLDPPTQCMS